jgi:hypothetical protein
VSAAACYLGSGSDVDVRRSLDRLDEVVRHASLDGLPANNKRHTPGVARKV